MDASILDKICMKDDSPTIKSLKRIVYTNLVKNYPEIEARAKNILNSEKKREYSIILGALIEVEYNTKLTNLAMDTNAHSSIIRKEHTLVEQLNKYLNRAGLTNDIEESKKFLEEYSNKEIPYHNSAMLMCGDAVMKIIPVNEDKKNYEVSIEFLERPYYTTRKKVSQ